jgi:hypothetical protein
VTAPELLRRLEERFLRSPLNHPRAAVGSWLHATLPAEVSACLHVTVSPEQQVIIEVNAPGVFHYIGGHPLALDFLLAVYSLNKRSLEILSVSIDKAMVDGNGTVEQLELMQREVMSRLEWATHSPTMIPWSSKPPRFGT